jgi:hypothetical protein
MSSCALIIGIVIVTAKSTDENNQRGLHTKGHGTRRTAYASANRDRSSTATSGPVAAVASSRVRVWCPCDVRGVGDGQCMSSSKAPPCYTGSQPKSTLLTHGRFLEGKPPSRSRSRSTESLLDAPPVLPTTKHLIPAGPHSPCGCIPGAKPVRKRVPCMPVQHIDALIRMSVPDNWPGRQTGSETGTATSTIARNGADHPVPQPLRVERLAIPALLQHSTLHISPLFFSSTAVQPGLWPCNHGQCLVDIRICFLCHKVPLAS